MELDASRVRRPSRRFGWVDRRVVHEGHLAALGAAEIAVYLVLCIIADQHGLSWASPRTLAAWVKHPPDRVRTALGELARRNLVAVAGRLVQVLDLDVVDRGRPVSSPAPVVPSDSGRTDVRQHPQSALTAAERLALLPAAVREDLLEQARQKLTSITKGRAPSRPVLEAVACGLIREPVIRP